MDAFNAWASKAQMASNRAAVPRVSPVEMTGAFPIPAACYDCDVARNPKPPAGDAANASQPR